MALHARKSLSELNRLKLIVAKHEVEIARLNKYIGVRGAGTNLIVTVLPLPRAAKAPISFKTDGSSDKYLFSRLFSLDRYTFD